MARSGHNNTAIFSLDFDKWLKPDHAAGAVTNNLDSQATRASLNDNRISNFISAQRLGRTI